MDIIPFNFKNHNIRVIQGEDGEPWFIAMDVAEILDYSDTNKMTSKLDSDETQNRQISGFGNRGITLINESGLYSVILRSDKPNAKPFKKWVTSEVLPSIRKTGSYSIAPLLPDFTNPAIAARAWADEVEQKQELQKQNEHQKYLIIASNEASIKNGEISIREFVKTNDAIDIGGTKFIAWMRKNNILFKESSQPKQYYVDGNYLTWKFSKEPINGRKRRELKITARGQLYLATKYMKSKIAKLERISEALDHNGAA